MIHRALTTAALCLLLALPQAVAQAAGPAETGDRAWARGDVTTALIHWSQALADARQSGDAAAELDLGLRVAAALRTVGKLDIADALLDDLGKTASTPLDQARVAIARGQWELAAGRLRTAEKTLATAYDSARQAADPNIALTAALALGDVRSARGDGAGARKAWQAGLVLAQDLEDRVAQGDAATRLGQLDRREGDLAAAQAQLEQAVSMYRAASQLDGEADAQAALARVLADLGDLGSAAQLLSGALATARDRQDVQRQASLLATLGQLQLAADNDAAARQSWLAARKAFADSGQTGAALSVGIDLATLDEDVDALDEISRLARQAGEARVEARATLNLAVLLGDDQAQPAERHARRALQLADELGLSAVRWRALALLGNLALDAGRIPPGIRQLQEAIDEVERTRLGLAPDAARGFVGGHEELYTRLIDVLLAEERRVDAFVYAQRLQLLSLPPIDAAWQGLVAEEAWLGDALADATARDPDSPQTAALRRELSTLKVEFAASVDRLRAEHSDFDSWVRVDPEELEAVQGDLDPGVVVVQPVLLPDGIALMVVRREGLTVVQADVTAASLDAPMRTLLAAMRMPGMLPPAQVTAAADALGLALLAPIADQLDGAEVIVFCPSGRLRQLAFAMLRLDGRYLVEDAAVVSVTHVGSLARSSNSTPRDRVTGPGLLLLGNPDGTLPGAEAEVNAIARSLPGATVVTGGAGTAQALRQHATGKQTVHLATHGWVDTRAPEQSFLVLAPDGDDDGKLHYGEIPGLGPFVGDARLVVLSACESAVPVDASDRVQDDGTPVISINGLAAQFRRAGVETLVASLWKVDDDGTQQLMTAFYAELARGTDVARALRAAQLSLLSQEDWSDPFYWAAFTAIGDWR